MADNLPDVLGKQVAGFTALPMQRQFGLVLGVALVVAVGVTIAMWGMQPTYQVLLPGMSERDQAQALTVLGREGIRTRLDPATGTLMVPATSVHEARLKLATEGLPRSAGVGFELLDEDRGLGTSRMQETARYQRALEGELTRSIMTLSSVNAARVHLALPRQSVFVRDRVRPSASVLVDLHPGRTLDETQIAGIVHMVASSVPELEAERVTVLDQRGRLLSQPANTAIAALPARQLDYTRRVEELLLDRI
jgi:flagellar M-ring protein FliF